MTNNQKLVGRHKRLAFMKVGTEGTYDRITGFTSLIEGKEAKEYARQYIDVFPDNRRPAFLIPAQKGQYGAQHAEGKGKVKNTVIGAAAA